MGYFPTTEFLDARVTPNSSYVWRSIAASRPVLQKGIRWQIGDGKTTRIWKDNWIPRESCLRILTSPAAHWNIEATVETLLRMEPKQWNVRLLNECFSQEEVDLIRGIPLSLRNVADRRVWHYDLHGKFTVLSAYHVARRIIATTGEGHAGSHSATSNSREKLWKKLWSACVPGKVKICVW